MSQPTYDDVTAAAERIAGLTRTAAVVSAGPGGAGGAELFLALDFLQHSGSFKDRGGGGRGAPPPPRPRGGAAAGGGGGGRARPGGRGRGGPAA
ncbi:threonine/serine dehydratase, partial [Kitasatospora indigofera]